MRVYRYRVIVMSIVLSLTTNYATLAASNNELFSFDSTRSWVEFHIKTMRILNVVGKFSVINGNVHISEYEQIVVNARIDTSSVQMRNKKNNRWAKSAEFFDVARHPEIMFTSNPFPSVRLTTGGDLPGTLTMRGVSQPVVFSLAQSSCKNPGYDCPIEAEGRISRSAFGMITRKGFIADKVQMHFSIFAVPATQRVGES